MYKKKKRKVHTQNIFCGSYFDNEDCRIVDNIIIIFYL